MSDKTNITYIISNISKVVFFEWIAKSFDLNIYNPSFIILNDKPTEIQNFLLENNFTCYHIYYKSKKHIPCAVYQTIKILKKEKTDILHAHLLDASLIGLLAAKIAGVKKRIHTRHHANFHHEHFKKGVCIDNIINYLSTDIIVISKNVKSIVETKEKFHSDKIRLIYHGFKLDGFDFVPESKIQQLKHKYSIDGYPVIGMISRYETGKGIEYCITAFKQLLQEYPDAKLVIANAYGQDKDRICQLLHELPPGSYTEIRYEKEINVLYKCFDCIVHVPIDATFEAFGQVYIEAMAASVPGIYTLSGIATEYIENDRNAIVVDYKNSGQIYLAIKKYLDNPSFKEKIIQAAKKDVTDTFGFDKMMIQLNKLYSET